MTPEQKDVVDKLRQIWPDKADEIERNLANGTIASDAKIKISVNYTLEKFDGDYVPGKRPVEVIRGKDSE